MISPEQIEKHKKLTRDLEYFSRCAPLMVKPKMGPDIPFALNGPQQIAHKALEDQIARTGKVRAIFLKARQEGISTYIAARFFHKAVRRKSSSVFILSHDAPTTQKLFKMVKRFYEQCNPAMRPATAIENRTQYEFADVQSDYSVGTAGSANTGRGSTTQYLHLSEVAYYENSDGVQTGVMQTVPGLPGTEIILESTANGMTGMFYEMCMDAMQNKSEYILIFLPWFIMPEYSTEPPEDFTITSEEKTLRTMFNLTNAQLYWRRNKIAELRSVLKFKREYPSHPMEAFQTSGISHIDSDLIMRARKLDIPTDNSQTIIMGVDPGRNKDRTVIAYRQGRKFLPHEVYGGPEDPMDEMRLAGIIARKIDKLLALGHKVKCFIDVGNGYGTVDRLRELGYGEYVTGVHFGSSAMEKELYRNKRAEMWCNLGDWIEAEGHAIPDSDALHSDLVSMPKASQTSNGIKYFPLKAEIKQKYGRSPDIGDAYALTFAFPVVSEDNSEHHRKSRKRESNSSSLRTVSRVRRLPSPSTGTEFKVNNF